MKADVAQSCCPQSHQARRLKEATKTAATTMKQDQASVAQMGQTSDVLVVHQKKVTGTRRHHSRKLPWNSPLRLEGQRLNWKKVIWSHGTKVELLYIRLDDMLGDPTN